MSRPRSERVEEIKAKLCARLREGVYRPGDRFLSTRELATRFEVSYQTAHRLMEELCAEGWLERRAASGTFVPGGVRAPSGVALCFDARARRPHSFGARILTGLTQRLDRDRVDWQILWADAAQMPPADRFPVLWESPTLLEQCAHARRSALLLADRPSPGLQAAFIDSVSVDDYSGGVCAAQLLLRACSGQRAFAMLSGPPDDPRSRARRDGFLSLAPDAPVVAAQSWFVEAGLAAAATAIERGRDGLFCGNDRLAEGVIRYCREQGLPRPRLVGFDDAPIAEQLDLTTIAIPWEELIADTADVVRRRMAGDLSTGRQLIVTPRPVVRRL